MILKIEKILIEEGKTFSIDEKQKERTESDYGASIYAHLTFDPSNGFEDKIEEMKIRVQLPHLPQKYLDKDYPELAAEILNLLREGLSLSLPSKH